MNHKRVNVARTVMTGIKARSIKGIVAAKDVLNRPINWKRVFKIVLPFIVVVALISLTLGKIVFREGQAGLVSFSILHFAGYLFFLIFPVEALLPIYINDGNSAAIIFVLAIATATAAQLIDYAAGRIMSKGIIEYAVGEKRLNRAHTLILKWGWLVIFFFNITPLSSPIIMLVAGVLRYPLWKAMAVSIAGLSAKYAVIAILA